MHRGWKVTGNMFFTEKQRKTRAAIQSISSRRCQALEFSFLPLMSASKQRPVPTHNQEETDGAFDEARPGRKSSSHDQGTKPST